MQHSLIFWSSDPQFAANLSYVRNWRIDNHLFDKDCTVVVDGRAISCSTCFVRPDPRYFEADGLRWEIERVSRVEYRLPKLPTLYAMRGALAALEILVEKAELMAGGGAPADCIEAISRGHATIAILQKEVEG